MASTDKLIEKAEREQERNRNGNGKKKTSRKKSSKKTTTRRTSSRKKGNCNTNELEHAVGVIEKHARILAKLGLATKKR